MKTLRSTSLVINALGGNRAVAAHLSTTPKAVSNWRGKKFPANTYVIIQSLLLSLDIYAPTWLWAMKLGKSKRKTRTRTRSHDRVDKAGNRPVHSAVR